MQIANQVISPNTSANAEKQNALRKVSRDLEASFLAEMLKSAGLSQTNSEFGGGAGEDHFSSFLTQAQAQKISESSTLGLSEQIFKALMERENG